jgi:hypothetical protein
LPGSGTHVEPLHALPLAQSAELVQLVLQLVAPQAYAPQLVGTSLHAPAPSHVLG